MKILLLLLTLLFAPLQTVSKDRELDCLARNVYYESRGESREGKLAVALVTLNRADSPKYPNSICQVVYQKNQFSWTKKYAKINTNSIQWRQSKDAAIEAFMNREILGTFKATHFHSTKVSPRWKLRKVAKIGSHIFYQ